MKPNIIIFNPDEMRWDTMGHMGNAAAVTPHLDAFAEQEAVSFANAYCQNPVCVPSRCSFFTGLYPHVHGHRTMQNLLKPWEGNMFKDLMHAGYHVWMNSRNDLFAGQYPGWAEENADEIFYNDGSPKAPGPVHPSKGREVDRYSHFTGELKLDENGKNRTGDDQTVDAAIERIRTWNQEQPLCMFLGLMYPHVPYQVEEPYFSAIDRTKIRERIHADQCTGKSKMLDKIREYALMKELSEEEFREIQAVYLGMCMKVDEQFGRLCEALKEAGMYENTLIVVLSDHGDFAGDYDLVEKAQSSLEDCLVRVPLLIKPPFGTCDAGISDTMTELIDFHATVMDYAGVEPSYNTYGQSLRPVLENRAVENRVFAFAEGGRNPGEWQCDEYHAAGAEGPAAGNAYYPKMMAQYDDHAHAKAVMIRSKTDKYISRITDEDEYYDLVNDPYEMHNLIDDPSCQARIRGLQKEMLKWLQRTDDVVPKEYDMRFTPEMLWQMMKDNVPAEYAEDVRDKINHGMDMINVMMYVASLKKKS